MRKKTKKKIKPKIPKKLTNKVKVFIAEYCRMGNGFNATQAAIKAGYSKKTAYSVGNENLKKPEIKKAISDYMDAVIGQYKDTLEYELLNYYKIRAFYDPSDIVDANGQLLCDDLKEYGKLSIVIEGVKTKKRFSHNDAYKLPVYVDEVEIKLTNREKAMEKLTDYIGMIENKLELKIPSIEIGLPPMPVKIKKGKLND